MTPHSSVPIFRAQARTFWFAARFLPTHMRTAVNGLYSFARAIDDLVDEPTSLDSKQVRSILSAWHDWLAMPTSADAAPDPRIASALLPVLVQDCLPARYLQLLLEGVASDLNAREMACWPELREYCVQVASSVGLAICHLLGAGGDPLARQAAVDLGIAMQLTNILRDLPEDLNKGRVYLPADELAAHGSSREHLLWLGSRVAAHGASAIDEPFRDLMRAQIGRARAHYERGLDGVWRLPPDMRFAILLAGRLYAAILDVIEVADYDVFSRRAATSTWLKLTSTARWWFALRTRPSRTTRLLAPEAARTCLAARTGKRVGFYETNALVEVRMFSNWQEAWRNWPRSLATRDAAFGVGGWLALLEVLLAQGLPLTVLLLRPGRMLRAVNVWLVAMRIGVLCGTARAYPRSDWSFWLSSLADLPVALALWRSALARRHDWRGRTYVSEKGSILAA
jgi:15-cis-phytoene synthase